MNRGVERSDQSLCKGGLSFLEFYSTKYNSKFTDRVRLAQVGKHGTIWINMHGYVGKCGEYGGKKMKKNGLIRVDDWSIELTAGLNFADSPNLPCSLFHPAFPVLASPTHCLIPLLMKSSAWNSLLSSLRLYLVLSHVYPSVASSSVTFLVTCVYMQGSQWCMVCVSLMY